MDSEEKKELRRAKLNAETKKRMSKADEEKAATAMFASPTRNLVLWMEPIEEERVGQGYRTKPGSGKCVEFTNGLYTTNDQKVILWMVQHTGFRVDFHPLPRPGDWWETHEFFKKDTTEVLSPTAKAKLRKDEVDKIIGADAKELAKLPEAVEVTERIT